MHDLPWPYRFHGSRDPDQTWVCERPSCPSELSEFPERTYVMFGGDFGALIHASRVDLEDL